MGLTGECDLKSEGRRALAGEKITHLLKTTSFLISGLRPVEAAIAGLFDLDVLLSFFFLTFLIRTENASGARRKGKVGKKKGKVHSVTLISRLTSNAKGVG